MSAETVTVTILHLCRSGASGAVQVRFASGHSDSGWWWVSGRWPDLRVDVRGLQMAGAADVVETPIRAEVRYAARLAGLLDA